MADQQLSNMVYVQNDADFSRRPVKPGERADNLPHGYTMIYAGPPQPARLAAVRAAFGPVSTVQYTITGLRFTSVGCIDSEREGETPYFSTWSADIFIDGTEHDHDGEMSGDPEEPRKRGEAKISVFDLYRCAVEEGYTPPEALDIDGSMEFIGSVLDHRHCRLQDNLAEPMLGTYTDGAPCIESLVMVTDLQLHWPCRSAGLGRQAITRMVRTLRPNGYVLVAVPVIPIQVAANAIENPSKHPTRNPYRLDMLPGEGKLGSAKIVSRYESDSWTHVDGVLYRVYHDGNPVDQDA